MRALRLALLELRRFRGPLLGPVPVALALVPLLYGAVYLWAYWDPYGRLDRVPVAVVDQDRAVTAGGGRVDAGQAFVRQLELDRVFDWRFVDAAQAARGLQDGRFSFVITVPPDFSARLVRPAGGAPARGSMLITLNDANGYLAGKLAETTRTALEEQVDVAARTAYAQRLLGDLGAFRERLARAATGAGRLQGRAGQARQHAAQALSGLTRLQSGTARLTAADQQLAGATRQVDQAVSAGAAAVAGEISATAQVLVDSAATTAQATGLAAGGAGQAQRQAAAALGGLAQLGQAHPGLRRDPAYQRAVGAARQAGQTTAGLSADAQQAQASAEGTLAGAQRLQSGAGQAQQQLRTAATRTGALATGAQQAADAAKRLRRDLAGTLRGARSLRSGTGQLNGVAAQVAGGLRDASRALPLTSPQGRASIAGVLGSPVDVRTANLHPAGVYGRGLAPLLFGVALWVFGLIAYLVLRPLNPRALAGRARAVTVALAGWLPGAALGAAGALALYGVVDAGLGLDPLHPLWTVGLLVLAAWAFVAVQHFLRAALGAAGHAVSLVLLVLQLTASGGLYPVQTTPAPLQALHPVVPMTYLVDGLRVTISGGEVEHLVRDAAVLGGVLLAFLALGAVTACRRRAWTMARLKPAVEL